MGCLPSIFFGAHGLEPDMKPIMPSLAHPVTLVGPYSAFCLVFTKPNFIQQILPTLSGVAPGPNGQSCTMLVNSPLSLLSQDANR